METIPSKIPRGVISSGSVAKNKLACGLPVRDVARHRTLRRLNFESFLPVIATVSASDEARLAADVLGEVEDRRVALA
jgi:hypothetical protein